VLLKTPAQRDAALSSVRETILSARNHPSVITHSVANELSPIPDAVPGTRIFLGAARGIARELDPTIPASVDLLSYPGYGRQRSYAQYELLGINSYFGWYKGKKDHSVERLADLGPYLDRMRKLYPTQALQVTEFGAESTFAGPATQKETFAFQTQYLKDVLGIIKARPFIGGAIYWTLREFAVKPNWVGGVDRPVARDSIHNKGLITYSGRKKPAWTVAERDFAETPMYRNVSVAAAANVPSAGSGDGGSMLAVMIAAGLMGVLAVDGWALAGIWRRGRRRAGGLRPDGARPPARAEGGTEPAGARAA
jgi:beta-glucuronidase